MWVQRSKEYNSLAWHGWLCVAGYNQQAALRAEELQKLQSLHRTAGHSMPTLTGCVGRRGDERAPTAWRQKHNPSAQLGNRRALSWRNWNS